MGFFGHILPSKGILAQNWWISSRFLLMSQLATVSLGQNVPGEALVDDSESIRRIEPSTEASDLSLLTVPGETANLEALGIKDLDELEDFDTESDAPLIKPVDGPARTSNEWAHYPEEVPRNQRRQTLPGGPRPPSTPEIAAAYDKKEADRSASVSVGKPTVKVKAQTGATWDDNIFLNSIAKESDTIFSTSVSTSVQAGNFNAAYASRAKVEYTPQAYVFVDHSEENSIDHDAEFEVQYTARRATGAVRGSYRKTSGGNPDFGERVDAQVGNVELMMAYAFTSRTRAEITGRYTDRRYDADYAFDSKESSAQAYVDYEATDKTHLAAGLAAGKLDVDGADSAQNFQRALLRMRSQITSQTQFTAEGGADFRQTDAADRITPVVQLALNTAPQEGTELGLRLTREIQPSGSLGGQNYVRTGLGLSGSQRLTDRFKFTLDAGYDRYSYESASGDSESDREDDFYSIRPGLRYEREHVNAGLFYEYRKNTSSDTFSYDVNRVGISLGTQF
jgi:hypothetical protein